jgi:ATP adenylyltransferase
VSLERLWAGWRSEYVEGAATAEGCVFCRILASDEPGDKTYIVRRDAVCAVVLNAYPYASGHLLVMPVRHVSDLEELDDDEAGGMWRELADSVRALKTAYTPDGLNVGANLGRSAGAGVPGHFHMHCVPRWNGDTNFMTTLAETRMLPEALPATYEKVRKAWPTDG